MSLDCARARRLILDRELGRLEPERAIELERHLADCPACPQRIADEAWLTARLGAIGPGECPVVDVRARVLREIATRRPAPDQPPVGWAVGIAALVGAALLGWTVAAWPGLISGLGHAWTALGAVLAACSTAIAALAPIGAWILEVAQAMAQALGSLAPLARAAGPAILTLLVVGAGAAAATIALAVARDIARGSGRAIAEEF